jgi:hypothetical protein
MRSTSPAAVSPPVATLRWQRPHGCHIDRGHNTRDGDGEAGRWCRDQIRDRPQAPWFRQSVVRPWPPLVEAAPGAAAGSTRPGAVSLPKSCLFSFFKKTKSRLHFWKRKKMRGWESNLRWLLQGGREGEIRRTIHIIVYVRFE